jgi:type I restriction enzyme M protein
VGGARRSGKVHHRQIPVGEEDGGAVEVNTRELIDRIFKEPGVQFELTEFGNLGKPTHEILAIYPKAIVSGKDAGKTKYFLKSFIPFSSGNEEVQVYSEGGKSAPEEIVRQLWVYKLIHQYDYKADEIDLEKSVQFGTEVGTKAADIIVYTDATKVTPKIIVECKKPKRKDGIEQLKSYMNAKGAPVAVWSNGADSIILYRPYPAQFDDTLFDLPKRGQAPKDVLEARKTLLQLKKDFNFKKIIQDLEELVLADSGKDEFNEIFKLIFAKIWDEREALENRKDKVVEFRKAIDPEITFDRINHLFHKACDEWPGIFKQGEDIELAKRHLQVCVGPIEGVRLMGSNLRIMDDAFEYLLPTEAKKKKGQFFTPRHVVEMCVRMLNPTRKEYVMDPACGSGGFLLHAMDWCYPATDNEQRELRKHRYAAKYLWGIDFETRAAKTSRALMLIAGDGHTNIFGPDVSSLDPKTWYETGSGQTLMNGLRQAKLTAKKIPENEPLTDDDKAWEYFDELKFDVVFANPPFAGEMKDRKMLVHYELARPALKRAGDDKQPKEERDVLFIERILKILKPGGRAAIVLPQGKFNNSSLAFIREWILKKARLLAVVGLHANTFKPHTGTKTSVLFVQKYTQDQVYQIAKVHDEVAGACPDYEAEIKELLATHEAAEDVPEEAIPEAIGDLLVEAFAEPEPEETTNGRGEEVNGEGSEETSAAGEDRQAATKENLNNLKSALVKTKQNLIDLESDAEALAQQHEQEISAIAKHWTRNKSELNSRLKPVKAGHKTALAALKEKQKEKQKALRTEIKALEKQIPQAERELKTLTNRGKLELMLADEELIGTLKERWIAAEVAKRLDYTIYMAVSERGGKDNSGDYEYVVDKEGSLVEFPDGHPQEGQLVVNQDLVNYDFRADELVDATQIPDDKLCVAEAFIRFAQQQKFSCWGSD